MRLLSRRWSARVDRDHLQVSSSSFSVLFQFMYLQRYSVVGLMDKVDDLFVTGSTHVYAVDLQEEIARPQTCLHGHSRHVDTLEELQRWDGRRGLKVHL